MDGGGEIDMKGGAEIEIARIGSPVAPESSESIGGDDVVVAVAVVVVVVVVVVTQDGFRSGTGDGCNVGLDGFNIVISGVGTVVVSGVGTVRQTDMVERLDGG